MFNDIILSMDNKASCYLVLLDLSSAFDTLNHRIISYRLREIGIHGQVHNWLMSFISNRISTVKIKSSLSAPFYHTHGVPQGSVGLLGPTVSYWVLLGPTGSYCVRFILFCIFSPLILFFLNTHIFVITSLLMTYKFILFFHLVLILK